MILYVNACVRSDSRTKRLSEYLLSKLHDDMTEHRLCEIDFPKADEGFLRHRDSLTGKGGYGDELFRYARDFAAADTIVIASPYWDLSFTAALKQYIEQINVTGITFRYSSDGIPVGLCKAKRVYYVSTAGGNYVPSEFGFGYIKALCEGYYGIHDVRQIQAVGLDIDGADEEAILQKAMKEIDLMFR
ncbi:MAG: NAD(P)H-dependent oxidoreductase [Ruminococcus sp.]|nr:NAD(P)H-dependent oxidoreductase [Ruminococcus sp.]